MHSELLNKLIDLTPDIKRKELMGDVFKSFDLFVNDGGRAVEPEYVEAQKKEFFSRSAPLR